ncbi:molybdate ABC transporter substrate-binding protein [Robertmurraya sp. GLU-23]
MRKITIAILISCLFSLLSSCSQESEEHIQMTISAAASMKDVLTELKELYEQNHQVDLLFNFGGSGALKQQIIQGAPVDLFISASKDHVDELVEKEHILTNYYSPLVANSLVLIAPKTDNSIHLRLSNLQGQSIEKIAIGIPETVPAGSYAKEVLLNAKLWNQIENKLIYTKDVSQVLTYVETKNVDAGIVYKTDALTSKKVEVTENINPSLHSPIMYYFGVLANTTNSKESISLFEFLQSPAAQQVFKKYGFNVLD